MASVVVNIPDSVDLSKVNDIKLCIRYCKDNDNNEYSYVTDGFSIQEERPQGEWEVIWHKDIYGRWSNYYEYKCSVCHKSYNDYSSGRQTAFCPNCGADMKGSAK